MLDERHLTYGLNALGRAHETDYFVNGHRGAAIIAAYFLSREIEMEEGAADTVQDMIDAQWAHLPLCAPFPDERADPSLVARIVASVSTTTQGLRQAGHNVIFPALALKAFRDVPDALTPSRVEGICKLVEAFTVSEELTLDEPDTIPGLRAGPQAAEFILSEFLECVAAFAGRGQGWAGHLLTYGRSLLDLHEMGHAALAHAAEQAFRIYVKRIRMGPLETDGAWAEHPASDDQPQERIYWERRISRPIGLGHVFKYPCAYCGLISLAADVRLKQACRDMAHRIL